jgi:hypothetical protein
MKTIYHFRARTASLSENELNSPLSYRIALRVWELVVRALLECPPPARTGEHILFDHR